VRDGENSAPLVRVIPVVMVWCQVSQLVLRFESSKAAGDKDYHASR
jgi:hypothetical protein